MGPTVKLAYVDQSRQALNDKNTVWQEISGGLDLIKVGNYETSSRGYVGRFNFKGVQQQQVIGDLSGGERNRVHLAKVLKSGGNVLLLDEPTNDLDIETCARSRKRWSPSPAARWSSRTIAGSSTASPRTSSPSKATRK
jgi:energy-dependent translational throttle protein EttA